MVRIENDCCDCASGLYPCTNCGLKHTKHYYCDICKDEVETLYKYDDKELCKYCVLKQLEVVE